MVMIRNGPCADLRSGFCWVVLAGWKVAVTRWLAEQASRASQQTDPPTLLPTPTPFSLHEHVDPDSPRKASSRPSFHRPF